MDFKDYNINENPDMKTLDEFINSEESSKVQPGEEIELIKSIQKQLEKEKKGKEEDGEEKRIIEFINKNIILKIKNFFSKFLSFLQYAGILILFFSLLLIITIFSRQVLVIIISYLFSVIFLGIYYRLLFNFIIRKRMNIPLNILNEISRGKLSFDILNSIDLKEGLGRFAIPLDTIIKKMSEMVSKIELSSMDLAGNSDALAYFATSMANKTDDQTNSIIKIDESAKKLNDSMQVIKKNVESAHNISKTSIEEANSSSVEILSLIEEMNRISEMSDKIVTTMNFIDDIAAETNLLALNAAIQAAHAGEEGKGFRVVATEIKNLAQSSSQATKTIYKIVESTIDSISKGVRASEKAKRELMKIISSFKSTEDLMSQINESINDQSYSTVQLKGSLENIHKLTRNINMDTQNMKSAISNLSGQAQILTKLISYFELKADEPIYSDAIIGVNE